MSAEPRSARRAGALLVAACLTALVLAACGSGDGPTPGAAATWDAAVWDAGRFGP